MGDVHTLPSSLNHHELHGSRSLPTSRVKDVVEQQHSTTPNTPGATVNRQHQSLNKQPTQPGVRFPKKIAKKPAPSTTGTTKNTREVSNKSPTSTRVTSKLRPSNKKSIRSTNSHHFVPSIASGKQLQPVTTPSKKSTQRGDQKIHKTNEEEQFLLGFTEEINELTASDEEQTAELSKTLHSPAFYKDLNQKKIKVTYNPKQLTSVREKKPKHQKHGAVVSNFKEINQLKTNATARIKTQNSDSQKSGIKPIESVATSSGSKSVKRTFLDKRVASVSSLQKGTIVPNRLLLQARIHGIQKRRNISVHNSVQSSANLDGVKLGKRFNINKNIPQDLSHDIQKRRNISVHNSVQSSANLDLSLIHI